MHIQIQKLRRRIRLWPSITLAQVMLGQVCQNTFDQVKIGNIISQVMIYIGQVMLCQVICLSQFRDFECGSMLFDTRAIREASCRPSMRPRYSIHNFCLAIIYYGGLHMYHVKRGKIPAIKQLSPLTMHVVGKEFVIYFLHV